MAAVGIRELRDRWAASLRNAGKNPRTVTAYLQDVVQLTVRLAGQDPTDFTGGDGHSPLEQMADVDVALSDLRHVDFADAWDAWSQGRAVSSRKRAHSAWAQFMSWVIARGDWPAANPFDLIERPAVQKVDAEGRSLESPTRKAFVGAGTEDLYVRLLRAAGNPTWTRLPSAFWPARDVALLHVIASTGARASEVVGGRDWFEGVGLRGPDEPTVRNERIAPMTWRRLRDAEAGSHGPAIRYTCRGKGGKERRLYLPREALESVRAYVAERDEQIGEEIRELWAGAGGARSDALLDAPLWWYRPHGDEPPRPLDAANLDTIVKRVYRDAGLVKPRGASVHALRHTYVSRKADAGVPVHVLQELAGHASIAVTQNYLHTDDDAVADAALTGLDG